MRHRTTSRVPQAGCLQEGKWPKPLPPQTTHAAFAAALIALPKLLLPTETSHFTWNNGLVMTELCFLPQKIH